MTLLLCCSSRVAPNLSAVIFDELSRDRHIKSRKCDRGRFRYIPCAVVHAQQVEKNTLKVNQVLHLYIEVCIEHVITRRIVECP